MATGDLSNNIRKLKTKLKLIKYTEEVNVNSLAEGSATAYLPVYHYAFTSYSPALAEQILGKDIELYGKSDTRFMESVYKVLRDFFSYKPPITKDQFFSRGFAERKVIMCTEILQLVKDKAIELNPGAAKTTLKTGVRPKSAEVPAGVKHAAPESQRGKRPASSKHSSKQDSQSSSSVSPRLAPHVVNELKSETGNQQPVRHVSHSQQRTSTGVRHVARQGSGDGRHSNTGRSSLEQDDGSRPDIVRHVAIRSPPDEARYQADDLSPEHLKPVRMCLNTPSIARVCPDAVEVVSMPKGSLPTQGDQSAIEINAPTTDSVLYGPVAGNDVQQQINSIQQILEMLTGQVQKFDSSMRTIEQTLKSPGGQTADPYIQSLETKIQSQLDNLMARMVLMENRVSIIETKIDTVNSSTSTIQSEAMNGHAVPVGNANIKQPSIPNPNLPKKDKQYVHIDEKGSSFAWFVSDLFGNHIVGFPTRWLQSRISATEMKFLANLPKSQSNLTETSEMSLMFSPIRQAAGRGPTGQLMSAYEETFALDPEDDARRSSTPAINRTLTHTEQSTICCNVSDGETQDKVARIKNMIKETQGLFENKQVPTNPS